MIYGFYNIIGKFDCYIFIYKLFKYNGFLFIFSLNFIVIFSIIPIIVSSVVNIIGSIDGLGTKRLFSIYVGINQNLSKLSKWMNDLCLIDWFLLIIASHSSSSSLLSLTLIWIGVSIAERLRDRGADCLICFDDLFFLYS